jgi:N-acetyl-anhydromuramyl-L-alanine amidase AmpD
VSRQFVSEGVSTLRFLRLAALSCAVLFLASPSALAAGERLRPPITWLKGEGNFTKAHRSPKRITQIVVHVTEGSFDGSVRWLKDPHAHASSHFVVSRTGEVVQLVHLSDIAWHAGNMQTNLTSVGIEHEGFTFGPEGFTTAQYRASARLAAWIARRSLMPIDRRHFIGHNEVPAPGNPFLAGGASGHKDPGPRWNWNRYLALVKRYVHMSEPLKITTSLHPGTAVEGIVPWSAQGKDVTRVEFAVNGRTLWKDSRAPFSFLRGRGLNTVGLGNGRHVLQVRAFGTYGRKRLVSVPVVVRNRNFHLTTAGARPWTKRSNQVRLRTRVWGAKAERLVFKLNGRVVASDRHTPYIFAWNARRARPGKHVLEVVAVAVDGRRAARRIPIVVPAPRPAAPAAPAVSLSLKNGETVEGLVVVAVAAKPGSRVELLVDGASRGIDLARPYTFGWDTSVEPAGPHTVTARATGKDGRTAEASVTVTVAPTPVAAANE